MPERRPRRALRTVRSRVTAAATATMLIVLVVASVGIVVSQRSLLIEALEEALESRVAEVVELAIDEATTTPLTGFGDDDDVVQVVTADGTVVASTANAPGADPIADPPPGERAWRTLDDLPVDDTAFRVLSVRVARPDGEVIVHAAGSLDDIEESTALLARSLGLAAPLVTAVLGGLVWVLVGRTLRPVEAIRAEVSAIGAADLHRRVPEPGTHDEIGRLAHTMNDMLARVEGAVVRQARFVADASHELRSPLTRIRAELEVDLAHPEGADLDTTHRSVLEEATGLTRLVDDLLLLARSDAGAGAVGHRPVDLDDIVTRVVLPRARAAGLDVDRRGVSAIEVRGDRRQLERVVANVADNAVRHARHTLTITLGADGGEAELAVADDGPGVPADQQERVFERFTRLDESRTAATGGTGLGLAIAHDIVSRHGGTITFDAHHAPGARVVIRLPLADPGSGEATAVSRR